MPLFSCVADYKKHVLFYQSWLNDEDARHQGDEKRMDPKQNLATVKPNTSKRTERLQQRDTDTRDTIS